MRRLLVVLVVLAFGIPALAAQEIENVPGCRINTLSATSGGCFVGGPTAGALVWVVDADPSATGDALCTDAAEAGETGLVALCRYTGRSWIKQNISSQSVDADVDEDCLTVAFTSTGTFGPYTVSGHVMRFDLDGDSWSGATTGASAEVTGNTDFGTLTFESCDLVGGEDTCAVYDGTTGAAGFVATAPRTVSVEITAAANPGTFTLCAW
jgi:hypothetical protein